ncbi:MAG: transporter [Chthoniobacterales bacterium]
MNGVFRTVLRALCLNLALTTYSIAGPPFLTDDPEPVDLHHWEAYLFSSGMTSAAGSYAIEGPAVELNYGALPDTQLHLIVPLASVGGAGMPAASGLGDMELGVKYRFVHETNEWPQIGIFPMAELPTGDESRGLGNGRTWYRLPLWVQKSWGPWTTYGGGGAVVNPAPGQRDYPFGGWLVQHNIGKHLILGGEIFAQGPDTGSDKGFGALNFGGFYNFNEHFSLLFSAGHSVVGDRHTLWYFGLYETW